MTTIEGKPKEAKKWHNNKKKNTDYHFENFVTSAAPELRHTAVFHYLLFSTFHIKCPNSRAKKIQRFTQQKTKKNRKQNDDHQATDNYSVGEHCMLTACGYSIYKCSAVAQMLNSNPLGKHLRLINIYRAKWRSNKKSDFINFRLRGTRTICSIASQWIIACDLFQFKQITFSKFHSF